MPLLVLLFHRLLLRLHVPEVERGIARAAAAMQARMRARTPLLSPRDTWPAPRDVSPSRCLCSLGTQAVHVQLLAAAAQQQEGQAEADLPALQPALLLLLPVGGRLAD